MRRLLLIAFSLLMLPVMSTAQEQERQSFQGYLVYGNAFQGFPGGSRKHSFGAGGELIGNGLGVGMEIGSRGGLCGDNCNSSYTLSFNGSYHFPLVPSLADFEPFVLTGYTISKEEAASYHFLHVGGGINYWFQEGLALRLEFRDYLHFNNGVAHVPEFRVGVTF